MIFTGQLRHNEILTAAFNMIISQQVFSDNIAGTFSSLVDKSRKDGSLFGDTKLFYATDCLESVAWDHTDANLLEQYPIKSPEVQAIVFDKFRQIRLTIDNYLTKRAFADEYTFSQFNSVMVGWMRDTKKIYDSTIYNTFIGTAESSANKGIVEIAVSDIVGNATGEEANRLEAEAIGEGLANTFIDLQDISRDFNDYKFLRSYDMDTLQVVWNSKYVNKIRKIDLPTMFHNDGLIEKFAENILPGRYFGNKLDATLATNSVYNADSNPTGMFSKSGNNYTIVNTGNTAYKVRSLIETDYTVSNVKTHVFPGESIPVGAVLEIKSDAEPFAYIENEDIVCKIMHKESAPYMSAFEVVTSFFNAKNLKENRYITFGHNTLEYLKQYPMITVYRD